MLFPAPSLKLYDTTVSRVKLYGESMSLGVLTTVGSSPELSVAMGTSKERKTPRVCPDIDPANDSGHTLSTGGTISKILNKYKIKKKHFV